MEEALRQGGPLGISYPSRGPRSSGEKPCVPYFWLKILSKWCTEPRESYLRVNRKGWEEVRKGKAVGVETKSGP